MMLSITRLRTSSILICLTQRWLIIFDVILCRCRRLGLRFLHITTSHMSAFQLQHCSSYNPKFSPFSPPNVYNHP